MGSERHRQSRHPLSEVRCRAYSLEMSRHIQRLFPNEDACATWLFELRWPDGFECPACGHKECCALKTRKWLYQCKSCRKQTSIRAGTLMQDSKLPLTTWFWAAYLVATHSNGISGLQLQKQLALGSYRTAWLLLGKLRASMVDPGRNLLSGLVEIDETSIHCAPEMRKFAVGEATRGNS